MKFAEPIAVLTHDVDKITETRRHVWSIRDRFSKSDLLRGLIKPSAIYCNIHKVMAIEDAQDVRSTFFLSTDLYSLEDVIDVGLQLQKQGWEIAFHLVYDEYLKRTHDPEHVKRKKILMEKTLKTNIVGVRNHYLVHFGEPTFNMQKKAGFKYDSSIRINDAKFKLPYQPLEGFYEVPLTIMDSDLWGVWKLTEKEGWNYITKRLEEVERVSGIFVFNAHQCSFRMRGGRLYGKLVREVVNRGFKVMRCVDLVNMLDQLGERS